ncbi:hypothetical protein EW145_g495 [Phellinidium pouzarii]|uniref:RNA polymerase II-associated protein 3 n=1 Tax=Phellinidium pouzarii TaxID=167371 RepID=A0A4S4LI11_9AGAM|nr:hypothetical protein EW145_g495 [Phellinidium pouzarii]
MATDAQKAKERGNAAFRTENFPEAVGHYSAAIAADRTDPTLPLNRAAAYLKLGKNVDAERDCSTVLRLKPGHVKALYRRAQARTELEKLDEAKKDLLDALQIEPNNDTDVVGTSKPPAPQRRRVPIEIVEEASTSGAGQTLTPIASRLLTPKPEQPLPIPTPSPARQSSSKSSPISTATSHQKTTPTVQGGIFRPSGDHTTFCTPSGTASSSTPSQKVAPKAAESDSLQLSPLSLFELNRSWELASPLERWDLLCKVPPQALPSLFKTSLEAAFLVEILEVCALAVSTTGDLTIRDRVRAYLRWFPRVQRFATVTLFLSKKEKEIAKKLVETVGAEAWRVSN